MSRVLLGLFTSAALIGCTIYQDQPPATPATAQPVPAQPAYAPPPAYAQPVPAQPAYAPPPAPQPVYTAPPATPGYAPPPPTAAGPHIVATPPGRPIVAAPTAAGGIQVLSATYGGNCNQRPGNVTSHIAAQCNGQPRCDYRVDHKLIGDPAYGCSKDYRVEWRCGGRTFNAEVGPEAGWGDRSVTLSCEAAYTGPTSRPAPPVLPAAAPVPAPVAATAGGIQVLSATYGGNCNQRPGNVTSHIAAQCNGQSRCDYRIDHKLIGDPAQGCSKDYRVEWRCGGRTFNAEVGPEAGWGDRSVTLSCEAAYTGPTSRPAPPVAAPATPPAAANLRAIQVVSATYGPNCSGVAKGNVTAHVAGECNGKIRCEYRIDHKVIGDPAQGCSKDYVVEWRCGGRTFTASAAREAGWGDKSVTLSCEPAYTGPMR